MSLTNERIQIESKIAALKKERMAETLKVDMAIINIREEASPLLEPLEIGISKLEIATDELKKSVERIREIDTELKKLERLL